MHAPGTSCNNIGNFHICITHNLYIYGIQAVRVYEPAHITTTRMRKQYMIPITLRNSSHKIVVWYLQVQYLILERVLDTWRLMLHATSMAGLTDVWQLE